MLGVYPEPIEMAHTSATLDQVVAAIEGDQYQWFAVLDSCDEPEIPQISRELGNQAVCLYRGNAARDFWAVAPYLWTINAELMNLIVDKFGETPWGVLIRTSEDLEYTRRQCRRFLIVEDPQGKELYFRFYDPRVLPTFLPTLMHDETREFFGNHLSFSCPVSKDEFQNFHLYQKDSKTPPQQQLAVGRVVARPTDIDSPEYHLWLANRIGTALQRTNRTVPANIVADQVTRGIRRAKMYNMTHASDVTMYIENICCYLGGFTDRPDPAAVQECLTDDRYEMSLRVSRLANLVRSGLSR